MSGSTWDRMSDSERASCVDAGRFHADGRTNSGAPAPAETYSNTAAQRLANLRLRDAMRKLDALMEPDPNAGVPGERPIDAWWEQVIEFLPDHVCASQVLQLDSSRHYLAEMDAATYAARIVAYAEEYLTTRGRK